MKKIIKTVSISIVFLSVCAAVFTYTPARIEAVDTRSEGFGGPHFADSASVYALFTNPSALAFAENKTLWPPITAIGMGGPLVKMFRFGMDAATGKIDVNDPAALAPPLLAMIGDSGFNFSAKIGGPLTFGAVRDNFGWGFVNTNFAGGNVFSLFRSDIHAGSAFGFVAGYAFPFDFGKAGSLSIGVSGRVTAQFETQYTKGVTELIGNTSDILKHVPFYLSLGAGFDIAAQYKIGDILNFAVVWQDVYSPVWIKTYDNLDALKAGKGSDFKNAQIESKLGVGIKADIPIAKAAGDFIPEWAFYADYNNIWPLVSKKNLYRNPILEFSFGTEMLLFKKVLAIRAGLNDMYPAVGAALNLGKFKMDFSVFGKELGFEPGYNPQLNAGFSMSIKY